MLNIRTAHFLTIGLTAALLSCACAPSEAAVLLEGQVQAGGGPVANSTVTLWAASTGEPRQLGQTKTSSDGRFTLGSDETVDADVILYIVAKGGEALVNRGSGDNPYKKNLIVDLVLVAGPVVRDGVFQPYPAVLRVTQIGPRGPGR
jgi:hypothetical protein